MSKKDKFNKWTSGLTLLASAPTLASWANPPQGGAQNVAKSVNTSVKNSVISRKVLKTIVCVLGVGVILSALLWCAWMACKEMSAQDSKNEEVGKGSFEEKEKLELEENNIDENKEFNEAGEKEQFVIDNDEKQNELKKKQDELKKKQDELKKKQDELKKAKKQKEILKYTENFFTDNIGLIKETESICNFYDAEIKLEAASKQIDSRCNFLSKVGMNAKESINKIKEGKIDEVIKEYEGEKEIVKKKNELLARLRDDINEVYKEINQFIKEVNEMNLSYGKMFGVKCEKMSIDDFKKDIKVKEKGKVGFVNRFSPKIIGPLESFQKEVVDCIPMEEFFNKYVEHLKGIIKEDEEKLELLEEKNKGEESEEVKALRTKLSEEKEDEKKIKEKKGEERKKLHSNLVNKLYMDHLKKLQKVLKGALGKEGTFKLVINKLSADLALFNEISKNKIKLPGSYKEFDFKDLEEAEKLVSKERKALESKEFPDKYDVEWHFSSLKTLYDNYKESKQKKEALLRDKNVNFKKFEDDAKSKDKEMIKEKLAFVKGKLAEFRENFERDIKETGKESDSVFYKVPFGASYEGIVVSLFERLGNSDFTNVNFNWYYITSALKSFSKYYEEKEKAHLVKKNEEIDKDIKELEEEVDKKEKELKEWLKDNGNLEGENNNYFLNNIDHNALLD